MPYVEFDINDAGLLARLKKIEQRLGNLKPLYETIGEHLLLQARERFDTTEASPQGEKWKPLSERYRRWKERVRPGKKKLTFDGNLKATLGYQLVGDAVVVGTVRMAPPKYARIHQEGGTIQQKARTQVIPVDDRGKFMARKKAERRKRGAIRIHIANIGERTITIPARPYIGINDKDRERIRRDTLKYILAQEG